MTIDWLPDPLRHKLVYLPALLDPASSPFLYMLFLILAAILAGLLLFFLSGFIYRELLDQQQKAYRLSLLVLPVMTALLLYQGGRWGAYSSFGLAVLASLYWHSKIKRPGELVLVAWAILGGAILALGFLLPLLSLTGLAFLYIFLVYRYRWHKARFTLLVRLEQSALDLVEGRLAGLQGRQTGRYYLAGLWELVYQVSLDQISQELLEELSDLAGVRQALVISRERIRRHRPD